MAVPYLLAFHGELVVVGKRPDGDSMRFVPHDPTKLGLLHRADRIDPASDGSVQLRFEGIDSPETHYGRLAQPLGEPARDRLLAAAGFRDVASDHSGTVTAATPNRVRATMLAKQAEANGRPVAYVIVDNQPPPADGQWTHVDESLLKRTLNAAVLRDGSAYLTAYSSTPAEHIAVLRSLAEEARQRRLGVWAADATREFSLVDQDSVGPNGQLILPKLFRRCSDYLKARAGGYSGDLDDWLQGVGLSRHRPEDDRFLIAGGVEVTLSGVMTQRNSRIRFPVDLLEIVFIEK